MAIRLRAMNRSDYTGLGGRVKTASSGNSSNAAMEDSLDSEKIFGKSDYTSIKRSLTRDCKRAYIELEEPTINHVLADPIIKSLFNLSTTEYTGLLNYTLAYDLNEEMYVRISELGTGDKYLCGGRLLEHLINNFDIEEAIYDTIVKIFYGEKILKPGAIPDYIEVGKSGSVCLVGDYFITFHDGCELYIKRKYNKDNVVEAFRNVCFKSSLSRLSMLLNLKDKEPLYGLLNYYIAVLPSGLRPNVKSRRDRLTKSYTRIITCNQKLSFMVSNLLPNEYVTMYRDLDNAVKTLQYKNMYRVDTTEGPVTVLDKLKGKTGQIRSNNLGRRQDYSGRAAVTVDPFMPITKVGLPKSIVAKIYKYHALPYLDQKTVSSTSPHDIDRIVNVLKKNDVLNNVPVLLGRQPTLHKQGISGFYVDVVEGNAIRVSPLICEPYNMDFDGDSGHTEVPLSDEAIAEVRDLMLFAQNIYYVKSGRCTTIPRMEMIYGLYYCTREDNEEMTGNIVKLNTLKEVYEAVASHKVKVWDKVTINGNTEPAGYAAFRACFPKPAKVQINTITSKSIESYINQMLDEFTHQQFLNSLQRLVELGFKVSRFYTQSMSLLADDVDIEEYDDAFATFEKESSDSVYYYNIGLEDKDTFNLEFSKCVENMDKIARKNIRKKLGENNAYVLMSDSGTRGNLSNLMQIFSYKGKIAASATETIEVVLRNSYTSQLTPMEGVVAAYGGRKGLMDKSLKTADTGYFSRQLWHATQKWVITNADCGTKEGFTIRDVDLAKFYKIKEERQKIMEFFITGRYEAGTNMYIDKNRAKQIVTNRNSVTVRSPLTCNNPCCQKCYGRDPGTHKIIAIGSAVGIAAAHSIGETSTQLTMKQFQKGGVAGINDVTSNFDRLNDFITLSNLPEKKRNGGVTSYEPLAWASGKTKVTLKGNSKIVKIEGDESKKAVTVPVEAVVSEYVEKGVGIYAHAIHGDYYLREIIDISGLSEAKKYLIYMLYNIHRDECEIVPVHFELLVASMSQFMIYSTDRSDLRVGQYASKQRLLSGSLSGTEYKETLIGIKSLHKSSIEAMDNIIMEDQRLGLARCNILGLSDDLMGSLQRIVLSLPIKVGTHYGRSYISERRLE